MTVYVNNVWGARTFSYVCLERGGELKYKKGLIKIEKGENFQIVSSFLSYLMFSKNLIFFSIQRINP